MPLLGGEGRGRRLRISMRSDLCSAPAVPGLLLSRHVRRWAERWHARRARRPRCMLLVRLLRPWHGMRMGGSGMHWGRLPAVLMRDGAAAERVVRGCRKGVGKAGALSRDGDGVRSLPGWRCALVGLAACSMARSLVSLGTAGLALTQHSSRGRRLLE